MWQRYAIWIVPLGVLLFIAGCSEDSFLPDGDQGTDSQGGDADTDTDADGGTDILCDEKSFEVEYVQSKLMILLDASGSMVSGGTTKWDDAVSAIAYLLEEFEGDFAFGLDIFPDQGADACSVDLPILFDTALGIEQQINDSLGAQNPAGVTPLLCALDKFIFDDLYAPNFTSSDGMAFLVLISDGTDNCHSDCILNNNYIDDPISFASRATALLAMNVRTITIGYDFSDNPDVLDALAENGGTEFSTYINAQNQAELEAAFSTIASTMLSCTFELDSPEAVADPDLVNIYVNGEVLVYDQGCTEGTGWSWVDAGHTAVLLCDTVCDQLKNGEVDEVSATVGCPTATVD